MHTRATLALAAGLCAAIGLSGAAAQDSIEQLSVSSDTVAVPELHEENPSFRVDQLSPTAASLPETPQPTGDRSAVVSQTAPGDDGQLAIPAPPAEAVDACEAAALGRASAPEGVDCDAILVADARTRTSDLAESQLLLADGARVTDEVSIRRLENADPEEIARRLASGFLVNAPAAQNVGHDQQQEPAPSLPGGIQVIPDPSRPADSPIQVNPR